MKISVIWMKTTMAGRLLPESRRFACAAALLAGLAPMAILATEPATLSTSPQAAVQGGTRDDTLAGRVSIESHPGLASLQAAAARVGVSTVKAVARVDYDAQGNVVDAAMEISSNNAELDAAILDWVRRLKLTSGQAGSGKLPMTFSGEDTPPAQPQAEVLSMQEDVVGKPSLRWVVQAAARSNLSRISTELLIDYDAKGNVTRARLTETTRSGAVDKALLQWGQRLKLKPGMAGSGRLPVTISTD